MKHIATFFCLLTLISCDSIFLENEKTNNPKNNFDLCWKLLDEHYCFFDDKNINWDKIYQKYSVKVHNLMSDEELFEVLASMLNELKDGHVNLRSNFDLSRNWDWHLNYPTNFDIDILKNDNYLGRNYKIAGGFYTKIIDDVPYFYFPSFSNLINKKSLDYYINKYKNYKGVILDVRDNGGGFISNIDLIASRFVKTKTLVGYRRYKSGKGHTDYTKKYEHNIYPKGDNQITDKKIVVLCNRSSYSAANEFCSTFKHIPNTTLIGDQSGGGGGMPTSNQLYNGWQLRYSSHQYLNSKHEQIEFGVEPDSKIDMDSTKVLQGYDSILDFAIEFVKQ